MVIGFVNVVFLYILPVYLFKIAEVTTNFGSERIGDVKHSLASIEKAKNLLGYDPKYDLEFGIKEAIDWYWNSLKNT